MQPESVMPKIKARTVGAANKLAALLAWLQMIISIGMASAIVWGYRNHQAFVGQFIQAIATSINAVSNVVARTAFRLVRELFVGEAKVKNIVIALLTLIAFASSASVHAVPVKGQGTWELTLQARDLDGNGTADAFYDTDLNITWLKDGNLFRTTNAIGWMNWFDAMTSVASLDIGGFKGWRLPSTLFPDASCQSNGSFVSAENCLGSEMGHLFYVELGNTGPTSTPTSYGLVNSGDFINLERPQGYWSGTEYPISAYSWYFHFDSGFQSYSDKGNIHYALAVHNGDIGLPVPEPGTGLLLITAMGLMMRFTRQRYRHGATHC